MKVKIDKKSCKLYEAELINYVVLLAQAANAQVINIYDIQDYVHRLELLVENNEYHFAKKIITSLKKLDESTKICSIEFANEHSFDFLVPGFENIWVYGDIYNKNDYENGTLLNEYEEFLDEDNEAFAKWALMNKGVREYFNITYIEVDDKPLEIFTDELYVIKNNDRYNILEL